MIKLNLSPKAAEEFLKRLEGDRSPNEALQKAAKLHKEQVIPQPEDDEEMRSWARLGRKARQRWFRENSP
jgi:hypothetical protein